MIRFLNLKNQICEGQNDFAFYDTVSDKICSFGDQGQQVFDNILEFQKCFWDVQEVESRPLSRFMFLIPEDYFEV